MRTPIALVLGGWAVLLPACSTQVGGGAREQRVAASRDSLDALEALAPLEALAEEPEIRAELCAVLLDYFGEPAAPRFSLLESWAALGFDPNRSPLEDAHPARELVGAPTEAILADNRSTWAAELAALEAGDLQRVGPWPEREVMNYAWQELVAQRAELGPAEFQRRAKAFFTERYPRLDEAAQMYFPNCARCHGRQGGGDGPWAAGLSPRPRDYRRGVFKFAAVEGGSKPRGADLVSTFLRGLPGSAMPAFHTISLAELAALGDYVRYLSIRGEVEALLVAAWEDWAVRPSEAAPELYELVWKRWLEAPEHAFSVDTPPADEDPARLALGEAVFHDRQRANCVSCHGSSGRGDGISAIGVAADGRRHALLRDAWGHFILPRDLTSGDFRGGPSREDVYRRIHWGIPGTPMPAIAGSRDAAGAPLLSEEEKWALVDYVLSLSGRGPFGAQDAE